MLSFLLENSFDSPSYGGPVKYYDPHTWPKHWTADDIKALLQKHVSQGEPAPNYDVLAKMLILDTEALAMIVRGYCKLPLLNVDEFLEENLGSGLNANPALVLEGRDEQVAVLDKATTVIPGTATRRVTYCNSIAGSGKSQFVKSFLLTKRKEAMERGLVIVRWCDKASWITLVKEDRLSRKNKKKVRNCRSSNKISYATAIEPNIWLNCGRPLRTDSNARGNYYWLPSETRKLLPSFGSLRKVAL
ncbi:Bodo-specific multi-copy gene family, putative [Bodo saltans]|uniref:Bodo-specific multi-copy gene family, putative n=1 Tax=Bodo saltans TaxID=75058 RepID=A0A0S4IQR3_BODSA|nr:Bodo-specific multi-copy gene family, putative [Bodo saltans]|eukprot:CUE63634.1 Bodo-specific multi-copy gene family, putative [Bodo saltans]